MEEQLTKDNFKCFEIRKQDDGLFKPIYQNELIQHCYGWRTVENKIILKPYSNNKISTVITQFNFWLEVFNTLVEPKDKNGFVSFDSLVDYNNFVDEIFRLIARYPRVFIFTTRYNAHNEKGLIIDFKDLPKGVIRIDSMDGKVEFLKLDTLTYEKHGREFRKHFPTLSQYKIEDIANLCQDGIYILDIGEMRMKPNPKFFKDGIANL